MNDASPSVAFLSEVTIEKHICTHMYTLTGEKRGAFKHFFSPHAHTDKKENHHEKRRANGIVYTLAGYKERLTDGGVAGEGRRVGVACESWPQ